MPAASPIGSQLLDGDAPMAGKSSHVSNLLYISIFILCSMSTFTVIVHGTLVSWGCHRSRSWEHHCMDLRA